MKKKHLLSMSGAVLFAVGFGYNPVHAQVYCTPEVSDCSLSDEISNVTFAGINNDSDCGTDGYDDFTTGTAGAVNAGMSYPFSITVGDGGLEAVAIWIDYNQDEVFDANEYTYIGSMEGGTITATVTIPVNALGGSTRMRVRSFYMDEGIDDPLTIYTVPGASCDEIGLNYGETEDYTITITAATACAGVPATLTATASVASVCTSSPLFLTSNATPQTGLEYQWESSTDGTTWADLGSVQTSGTYNATGQTATMQYRLTLTCTNSSTEVVSNTVTVTQNAIVDCICEPVLDCTDDDMITNVSFGTINNPSTCSTNGYMDYTSLPAVELTTLNSYPISVTVGGGWDVESVSAWIDYNHNGIFETSEFTYIGTGSASVVTGSITVPSTAMTGNANMRVRVSAVGAAGATGDLACDEEQGYGETEDYMVNITAASVCTGVPATLTISSTETSVCEGSSFVLSSGATAEGGFEYQWEYSLDGTTWTDLGTAQTSGIYNVPGQSEETQYRLTLTCTNSSTDVVSNVIIVEQNGVIECVCTPVLDCTDNDMITNVTFGAMTNISTCGADGYTSYINLPAIEISTTQSYPISVTVGDGWDSESVSVWIDYNQNGEFEDDEFTYIGTGTAAAVTGSITVPATAMAGNALMRVRVAAVGAAAATSDMACDEEQGYGETEDYMVNISIYVNTIDSIVVSTVGNIPAEISTPAGSLQLQSVIYPITETQNVTWSIINETGTATISATGLVTAQTNGTVWAKAVSTQNSNMADSIEITITNQDLGISNLLSETELTVFPNPTSDVVTLKSGEKHEALSFQVTDVTGNVLARGTLKANELNAGFKVDLSNFSNGMYFVKLSGSNTSLTKSVVRK